MAFSRIVRLSIVGIIFTGQLALGAAGADADEKFKWQDIAGVTTPVIAGGLANDVQGIPPGGRPWFTLKGDAEFRPVNGELRFSVRGLVLVGGGATGTADGVTQVKGTIVCNGPVILDSDAVPLSPQGDAEFHGRITPFAACANPIFLIRIGPGTPGSATDRWIAAGIVRKPGVGE